MGWCSGTDIFDRVVEMILKTNTSDDEKYKLIYALGEVLEGNDWDCQGDSDYRNEPLVRKALIDLGNDWLDEELLG